MIGMQPLSLGCGWIGMVPPPNLDRSVPRRPRLIGGFEGHNAKENALPGSPALWAGASQSGSLERGESAGGAEGAVLRESAPWLIAQMCRFKFSPERSPRSWA